MDARTLLIVDLDGPILDVAPRYWAAHVEAAGAGTLVADPASFWEAKRRSEPVARADAYAAAFKAIIERDDLLALDRVQPGALAALARLGARHELLVLSLRSNVAGATAAVERLGIAARARVELVPHNPDGKVVRARALAGARRVHAVIGDSEADAAVAEALAAPFWAVSCGIRTAERLRGFGAARVEASLAAFA